MKAIKALLFGAVLATVVTGCYTHKERVVERERPVVRERVIDNSGSTTIQTPDSTIRVR